MNQTRSSKLELAYVQQWLLTQLQRNLFLQRRLFLQSPSRRRTNARHGYISSLSSSAHSLASRGRGNWVVLRCSALFCMFACLACLSSHASSGRVPGWGGVRMSVWVRGEVLARVGTKVS